ncbi:MAG TPA: tetratricopeptide repeat protein [Burkholderiaceae bacterium]|nr:tetratricopeptide repeat protein [Burkholderiaceae bacterium]
MTSDEPPIGWEERVAQLWHALDDHEPAEFVDRLDRLVAELPPDSAIGLFERGAAQDSTGHPDRAVPLYRAALTAGLSGLRRRRAIIQLASSLRNLGDAKQAASLLTEELRAGAPDELDGAVRAFLALALVDLGREREAVAVGLEALSHYLPRYNRSLARYAGALATPEAWSQPARQSLALTSLVVRDYDEALAFYVGTLGFTSVEDTYIPAQDKRWVVVAPPGAAESRLLLARASNAEQAARVGNQTGGRVFLFLHTDDIARDCRAYKARGVKFVREAHDEPYGTVAVFEDLYGNLWDLIQPRPANIRPSAMRSG